MPLDRQRGADEAGEEERVYRPLLFQSTGYASSELFRDSYEMHSRLPTSTAPLLGVEATATDPKQKQRHVFEPQIRLETLSSRAATAVLWVTYVAFLLAMALPYLQSKGYLETVTRVFFVLWQKSDSDNCNAFWCTLTRRWSYLERCARRK